MVPANVINASRMGRLATWHLPGGPVGPPGRWAATSNVQVGQTTYPASRGRTWLEWRKERVTEERKAGSGM